MNIAIVLWSAGIACLLVLLHFYLKRGNVAAFAVLLILVPHVFIRPIMFFTGVDEPYPYDYFGRPDWDLISTGLLVTIVWILLFTSTYLLAWPLVAPLGKLLPQANANLDIRVLFFAALATTLLGGVATSQLIIDAGSIAAFIYQVKVGKELTGLYVIQATSVIGAIFSALTILYYEKRYRASKLHKPSRKMVWLGIGLMVVNLAFNYFWGNRYNIAMLAMAMGLAWHFHIQRIRFAQVLWLVLIAAVILQSLKMFRNAAVEEVLDREIARNESFWLNVSTSLHFTQFDAFILALRDAGDRFPFREGRDFLNGLLAWIPREFYPDKETFNVGKWFRQVYEPNVVNGWPVTTMGSWYVNFGYAGILLGGATSGAFAAWFDSGYRNVRGSFWQATVASSMAFLMFDGGVDTGFIQDIALVMVPIYILSLILHILRKRKLRSLRHQ